MAISGSESRDAREEYSRKLRAISHRLHDYYFRIASVRARRWHAPFIPADPATLAQKNPEDRDGHRSGNHNRVRAELFLALFSGRISWLGGQRPGLVFSGAGNDFHGFLSPWSDRLGYTLSPFGRLPDQEKNLKSPAILKGSLNIWRLHQIWRSNPSFPPSSPFSSINITIWYQGLFMTIISYRAVGKLLALKYLVGPKKDKGSRQSLVKRIDPPIVVHELGKSWLG